MFILYPTTVLKAITKEGKEMIIPPDYYKEKCGDDDDSYSIYYDKNMLCNNKVSYVNTKTYLLIATGSTAEDASIVSLDYLKERLKFKSLEVIDSYYIRDVSTSQQFYLGDRITNLRSGIDIHCPRTVIFDNVVFFGGMQTSIVLIEDSIRENKSSIVLTNDEFSYDKFKKFKYCPFYAGDYYIEPNYRISI